MGTWEDMPTERSSIKIPFLHFWTSVISILLVVTPVISMKSAIFIKVSFILSNKMQIKFKICICEQIYVFVKYGTLNVFILLLVLRPVRWETEPNVKNRTIRFCKKLRFYIGLSNKNICLVKNRQLVCRKIISIVFWW